MHGQSNGAGLTLKVLVTTVGSGGLVTLAEEVKKGVRNAGATLTQDPTDCENAFFGTDFAKTRELLEALKPLAGKKVAVFCLGSNGKQALEKLVSEMVSTGAHVNETLSITGKPGLLGFGATTLSESDLARAKAFGEKMANHWLRRHVVQHSDKTRIQGYVKRQ